MVAGSAEEVVGLEVGEDHMVDTIGASQGEAAVMAGVLGARVEMARSSHNRSAGWLHRRRYDIERTV
jgi:hypothetical protein